MRLKENQKVHSTTAKGSHPSKTQAMLRNKTNNIILATNTFKQKHSGGTEQVISERLVKGANKDECVCPGKPSMSKPLCQAIQMSSIQG